MTAALSLNPKFSATTADPASLPVASPWSPSTTLERIVFEDIFGTDLPITSRAAAMKLPPVARARNLLVSTICAIPLVELIGEEQLEPPAASSWLYATNRSTSPQLRLAWTVDDLIFHGWSAHWRTNSSSASGGFPLYMDRIPRESWTINQDNRVEVNGMVVADDQVTLIPGLHEGILSFGSDALRDTRTLYRNVRQRLTNPIPGLELHQTGGVPLTRPEIEQLVADWAAAREGVNGGVAYTNESITTKELGQSGEQLLIEARNAAALDLARLIGVSGGRIDATAPKASLNYETTTGRNQEFVDFDLALYMTPITARLSMDDIVPRGHRVAFDLSNFTGPSAGPTGPALED